MSDDGEVIYLPTRGEGSGDMPGLPSHRPEIPPETPEETTMELPRIPGPVDPVSVLGSDGIPDAPPVDDLNSGPEGETGGEYVHQRSLADRLGDWIEHRITIGQARHAAEHPFREAEIARKAALLKAKTEHESAMAQHNSKLRQAMAKARADRAAASGKGVGSGMGASKGGKSPAGPGGAGGRAGGSGASGRSGGGVNSPKGAGKGAERSPAGRSGAGRGKETPGGSKGRQNGSGGPGGSGGAGSKSGSQKGGGGRTGTGKGPTGGSGTRGERRTARQERAAARQEARQQRRNNRQAAGLADRTKDRDQARGNRQAGRDGRHAAKDQRAAERKAKKQAAAAERAGRTTLGAAVADEAQRRWDKRSEKCVGAEREKVNLRKDRSKGEPASGKRTRTSDDKKASGPSSAGPGEGSGAKNSRRREWSRKTGEKPGPRSRGRAGDPFAEPVHTVTHDWPGRDPRPGDRSTPAGIAPAPLGLPAAREPHTERPGTSQPTPQEDSVSSPIAPSAPSGPATTKLARQHQTDITFDVYLMVMANIAFHAGEDKDEAERFADVLGDVADALRDVATDLVGDHNVDTKVTTLIADLADAAGRMKALSIRCAEECGTAAEAAIVAAAEVARVYSEDQAAVDDAGLAYASAAAHH